MMVKTIIKNALMYVSALTHNDHGSKILYYHDVFRTVNYRALDADIQMGTPQELFAQHVDVIRQEGYEIVPHITEPKGQVAIMLDDGFRGVYECRDYFYGNNIRPTIFLPAGYVGAIDKGLLSKDEILDLQSHGFRFECHGWSHLPLTDVPPAELGHELVDSKRYLEELLNQKVESICLPLGFFTTSLLNEVSKAGYTTIYSSIPGSVDFRPHGMLPRNLCQFATPEEVSLILKGGNEILKSRYEKLHNHSS